MRFRLALAIGTSKYYLPKVLRPFPTYLLLLLTSSPTYLCPVELHIIIHKEFKRQTSEIFVPLYSLSTFNPATMSITYYNP